MRHIGTTNQVLSSPTLLRVNNATGSRFMATAEYCLLRPSSVGVLIGCSVVFVLIYFLVLVLVLPTTK